MRAAVDGMQELPWSAHAVLRDCVEPSRDFDPRFWYWLFAGAAREQFDAAPIDEQRQIVRASLRFSPPDAVREIAEGTQWRRPETVFVLLRVSAACRFIFNGSHVEPVA